MGTDRPLTYAQRLALKQGELDAAESALADARAQAEAADRLYLAITRFSMAGIVTGELFDELREAREAYGKLTAYRALGAAGDGGAR